MSRYTDHKAEIKAQLGAVAGIGNVYDAPKNPADEAAFQAAFVKNGVVNAVTISRADGSEAPDADESEEILETVKIDNWTISLYYGFKDDPASPSEHKFQELVEKIEDRFRFLQDLNQKCERSYPLNRRYSGPWQFLGGTLCHKAEWTLQIQSRIYNGQ